MSARSNENRLGAPMPPTEEAIEPKQPTPTGESLKFITPTEFVELPSRGQFYPPEHPLFNQEVIEIKHMTTKEEDILSSESLLRKGIAVDRFLENVLVDDNVAVDSVFSKSDIIPVSYKPNAPLNLTSYDASILKPANISNASSGSLSFINCINDDTISSCANATFSANSSAIESNWS